MTSVTRRRKSLTIRDVPLKGTQDKEVSVKKSIIAVALVASMALVACNNNDATPAPTTEAQAVESLAAEVQATAEAVQSMAAEAVESMAAEAEGAVESLAAEAEASPAA
jgi:PBP1b-binding outer membrane lipoprotein LpoB